MKQLCIFFDLEISTFSRFLFKKINGICKNKNALKKSIWILVNIAKDKNIPVKKQLKINLFSDKEKIIAKEKNNKLKISDLSAKNDIEYHLETKNIKQINMEFSFLIFN